MGGFPDVVAAPVGSCTGVFDDVDNANAFCPFIEEIYADDILGACDTGPPLRFCPRDVVTREQLAKAAASTLALSATQAGSWGISGNGGTTAGNFLGTTDDTPFEIRVNAERALRIAPRTETSGSYGSIPALIGGWSGNFIAAGGAPTSPVVGSVIAGGGYSGAVNRIHDHFDFIGGGADNQTGAPDNDPHLGSNVVAGGFHNLATGGGAVVGGGSANTASNATSVVAGGNSNAASEAASSVGGGLSNTAGGLGSTVPGGFFNEASGDYSFAAGYRATATGQGAFVWADSNDHDFSATGDNVFKVRATGGVKLVVGIDAAGDATWTCSVEDGDAAWSCTSDRNLKDNLVEVDGERVLEQLAALPVYAWNAKGRATPVRHLGPMAQDFRAAFGLGSSDRLINGMDLDGVALAAIRGLQSRVAQAQTDLRAKDEVIEDLARRVAALERAAGEKR